MLNSRILKIISTYRSGKYAFSANFNPAEVNIPLTKARTLAKIIDSLPITSLLGDKFSPEGLLDDSLRTVVTSSDDKIFALDNALENIKKAYAFATNPTAGLTEQTIKELQKVASAHLSIGQFTPGQYHDPPPTPARDKTGASTAHVETFSSTRILSDVKLLMLEFAGWINRPEVLELGSEIRAVLAHFHLSAIKPFAVSNAETATTVESMLLAQAGMRYQAALLPSFYSIHAAEYKDTIERTLRAKEHDTTELLIFALSGQVEGLSRVLDEFRRSLTGVALRTRHERLREERRITRGQFDLLSLMMAEREPVTLKKLLRDDPYRLIYRDKSERTARRDVARLLELGVLKPIDAGGYELSL